MDKQEIKTGPAAGVKIIPAVLEADHLKVREALQDFVSIATTIQVDVCDGVFVESLTWMPNDHQDLSGFNINLEFDMMVSDVEKYIDILFLYNPKKIVIHTRDMSIADYMILYDKIKDHHHFVSVAICDTDMQKIKSAYGYYDYIQLMGIEHVGVQGQAFDMSVIEKIKELDMFLENKSGVSNPIIIQIDGAMNPKNIKACKDAGATSFVVGSYLKDSIKDNKLKEVYSELKGIL